MNIKTVELNLCFNKIATIHPKAFWTSRSDSTTTHTKLKQLYLYNNKIQYIESGTFDPLINLENLYLYNNMLRNIDNTIIINLNKLQYLYIENNELTRLPTKWLPTSLRYIDISGNAIAYLSSDTFDGASNLHGLKVSLNNMTIEYRTFGTLPKLTTIEVDPYDLHTCTCNYIWYLRTRSDSVVCDNSDNNHISTREYLREECREHIPG